MVQEGDEWEQKKDTELDGLNEEYNQITQNKTDDESRKDEINQELERERDELKLKEKLEQEKEEELERKRQEKIARDQAARYV